MVLCRNCRTQCFLRKAKSIRVRCPEGPKNRRHDFPCYFNADNDQGASTFRKQVAESRKQFRRLSRGGRAFWFFAEIAAPNIFCTRQKICGYDVPEGAPIQKRHGKNRVILMRIMIRELRHSASKLRRVESNFGDLAAVGELFGSLPKLPHPMLFA